MVLFTKQLKTSAKPHKALTLTTVSLLKNIFKETDILRDNQLVISKILESWHSLVSSIY